MCKKNTQTYWVLKVKLNLPPRVQLNQCSTLESPSMHRLMFSLSHKLALVLRSVAVR